MAEEETVSGINAEAQKDAAKPVDAGVKVKRRRKAHKADVGSDKAVQNAEAAATAAAKRATPQKDAEPTAKDAPINDAKAEIPKELIVGAVVILAVILGLTYIMSQDGGVTGIAATTTTTLAGTVIKNANIAERYDIVSVDYTGMYTNGTVFDSSIKDVAEKAGVYVPTRPYEPVTFSLGYGTLIQGFEEAIEGMTVGQEKEVTIPPEKAYGYPREDRIQEVPKIQTSPIVQNVSIEKFRQDIGKEPVPGLEFQVPNNTDFSLDWPMRVLEVYNDSITFRYYPKDNTTISTVFGPADVYGTDTEIIIKINPQKGQKIVTLYGPAKIVDVNDLNATVDFNPELAGQTIKFRLKLLSVVKQEEQQAQAALQDQ